VTGDVGSSTPVRGGWVLFAVVLGSAVVLPDGTSSSLPSYLFGTTMNRAA
jgi:hypothetical protein